VVAQISNAAGVGGTAAGARTEATAIPELTAALVESFAYAGCTDREIADRFLVDESVIRRDFGPVLTATRALRKFTVRRAQFDAARDGNATMLTWLGRNELGQSLSPQQPLEPEPVLEEKVG